MQTQGSAQQGAFTRTVGPHDGRQATCSKAAAKVAQDSMPTIGQAHLVITNERATGGRRPAGSIQVLTPHAQSTANHSNPPSGKASSRRAGAEPAKRLSRDARTLEVAKRDMALMQCNSIAYDTQRLGAMQCYCIA